MQRLLQFSFRTALLLFGTSGAAFAQLEIGSNGHVSVGDVSPSNYRLLSAGSLGDNGHPNYNFVVSGVIMNASSNTNIGVYGFAVDNQNTSYGVFGTVNRNGPTSSLNYAVYGRETGEGSATAYAGYFAGDLRVTGNFTNLSDASLQENVQELALGGGVLSRLMRLRPHSFVYTRNPAYAHMSLPEGRHFGLIAQEVEEVFPNLVEEDVHPAGFSDDENGETRAIIGERIEYKSVNYIELIPVLVQAIQEQQGQIKEQRAEIEALKAALELR